MLNLPPGIWPPSIGAHPDGQLTLEWYAGVRRILSVSVDPQGLLHYAALIDSERAYGTKVFADSVPRVILELIQRVS